MLCGAHLHMSVTACLISSVPVSLHYLFYIFCGNSFWVNFVIIPSVKETDHWLPLLCLACTKKFYVKKFPLNKPCIDVVLFFPLLLLFSFYSVPCHSSLQSCHNEKSFPPMPPLEPFCSVFSCAEFVCDHEGRASLKPIIDK